MSNYINTASGDEFVPVQVGVNYDTITTHTGPVPDDGEDDDTLDVEGIVARARRTASRPRGPRTIVVTSTNIVSGNARVGFQADVIPEGAVVEVRFDDRDR